MTSPEDSGRHGRLQPRTVCVCVCVCGGGGGGGGYMYNVEYIIMTLNKGIHVYLQSRIASYSPCC